MTKTERFSGFWLLLPGFLIYLLFYFAPAIQSIALSFYKWNGIGAKTFIGLENFKTLLKDPVFWQSLINNSYFMVVFATLPVALGLICAVILGRRIKKGFIFFRTVYFLPQVISLVAVGIIWRWIYNPSYGFLNGLLASLGLSGWQKPWLGDPNLAIHALAIIAIWLMFGYAMVVFLAGLQKIEMDLYEAALVDGANVVVQFFKITVPSLRNELTVVIIWNMVMAMKILALVFAATRGGPGNATMVVALYAYRTAFIQNQVGYGAALTTIATLITVIISWLIIRIRERGETI